MKTRESTRYQILAHVVLATACILIIIPFLLLFMSSITDESCAIANGYSIFPKKLSLEAYRYIIRRSDVIGRAYAITILVTLTGTVCSLFISSLMAYGLAQKDLLFGRGIMLYVVFTMLFSGGLIPQYYVYTQIFHIKDTLFAYIVPNLMLSAFNVILLRNYYVNSIPESLKEAVKIDGGGEWVIFTKVVFPLSVPITATVGLMTSIMYWNDWNNALYYMSDPKMASIQQLLRVMNTNVSFLASTSESLDVGRDVPGTTVRMAIAIVAILPMVAAFPFFEKFFVKGITIGAVKE